MGRVCGTGLRGESVCGHGGVGAVALRSGGWLHGGDGVARGTRKVGGLWLAGVGEYRGVDGAGAMEVACVGRCGRRAARFVERHTCARCPERWRWGGATRVARSRAVAGR